MENELSLLGALGEEDRRAVLQNMHRRRFAKGEVIFHEGDPGDVLHVVDKGHVAVRAATPLGEEALLAVLGPGASFGEGALVTEERTRTATCRALDAVETRSLHRDDFHRLVAEHPAVREVLIAILSAQVRRLTEHLLEALWVPVDRRVCRRLLALGTAFGCDGSDWEVPVTQDDLAAMAGTTRPTANRALQTLAADGIVAMRRGHIAVLDVGQLERRAR
jgi:CRP-like cAMP-binding protein